MARLVLFSPTAVAHANRSVEKEFREFIDHIQRLALLRPAAAAFVLHWANTWIRDWLL